MIARLFVVLAWVAACSAVVGCGSSRLDASTGTGGTTGLGGSPGTVTFILATDAASSYCDQSSCTAWPQHLTITTVDGQVVGQGGVGCGTPDCTTCLPTECPLIGAISCPASEGFAYTGQTSTWDGSYVATSTCGASHTTCTATRYMPAGQYVAIYCATPGAVTQPDGGLPVCLMGRQQCMNIVFDFPSAAPVQATLPVPIDTL